jgi:transcriptional regulator GlxA family with amidase domain
VKVAFVAWENCSLEEMTRVLRQLRNAGCPVRTLTLDGGSVQTDCGLRLVSDGGLEHVNPRDFQLLLLPHGGVCPAVVEDHRLQRFIRQLNSAPDAWLAASGSASAILAAAGQLGGLQFTGPREVVAQFEPYFTYSVFTDKEVCVDGNVITSSGGAPEEFARIVCRQLGMDDASYNRPSNSANWP